MDKVILTSLKKIVSDKGNILHAIKKSDTGFVGFGEAYFSHVDKGSIKGWKKHLKMTLNLVVPLGEVQFVVYNEVEGSFCTHNLSKSNYQRLTVGPGLWVAFKGIQNINMLLNIASIEHDPSESISMGIDKVPYEW
jgi:dTDP-4-dehydrorhamnose 3,5-epimerase